MTLPKLRGIIAFFLVVSFAASRASHAVASPRPVVSLRSILQEMVDRSVAARLPTPWFTLKQASSHDPRKNDPGDPETWHSNTDYGQFIHTEVNEGRREWVIMEDRGPGAIVRFWTPLLADKDRQVIRFYFDGDPKPAITAKLNDLLSGQDVVKPPFAFVAWNETDLLNQRKSDFKAKRGVAGDLYLPIPYAKGCKITLDSIPFYYVINYRSYTSGTVVQTFSLSDYEAVSAPGSLLERTAAKLLGRDERGKAVDAAPATLAPNAEVALDLKAGAAAVREIRVRIDPREGPRVLRNVVLEASFDGKATVWCPIGDFFGSGVRFDAVHDWWRTVEADGTLTARWVMPYRRTGRLSLRNVGDKPVNVSVSAMTGPWRWDDRSLYFHSRWHSQLGLNTRPRSDWNYLEVAGRGRYAGDTLTVYSSVKDWYGEGDERIFLDGATFPAHIGTGTEDYYGYAWGMAGFFSSPFISMPKRDGTNQGDWRGYTTTTRLRLLDSIPFDTGLRHDMEVWNWAETAVDYSATTFWYALPGSTDNRMPQPREAASPLHGAPLDYKVADALECETLLISARFPGIETQIQDGGLRAGDWSGGRQLFVLAKSVGDFVELTIPVGDDRERSLVLYGTKSHDYGTLHFSVNGRPAWNDYDAYSAEAVASGPIELGRFTPHDGKLILRVQVAGANPASKGSRYYFGLDCVVLRP